MPDVFTPIQRRVLESLRAGATIKEAVRANGIMMSTFRQWTKNLDFLRAATAALGTKAGAATDSTQSIRTETNRCDPKRSDPNRAEASRADPNRNEPKRNVPNRNKRAIT